MGIEFKKRIHEGGRVAVAAAPLRAYSQLFEVVILMEEEFLIEILLVQADVTAGRWHNLACTLNQSHRRIHGRLEDCPRLR